MVKDLPYPYTSKAQYERSIDTPLGTEWNTRVGFQRGTLPKVVKKVSRFQRDLTQKLCIYWCFRWGLLSTLCRRCSKCCWCSSLSEAVNLERADICCFANSDTNITEMVIIQMIIRFLFHSMCCIPFSRLIRIHTMR